MTRQSTPLLLTDANDVPTDAPIVRYDPIARVITISPPNPDWLTVGQPYKLRFTLPPNDDIDDRGLRAIDRQTLDPKQQLEFGFFAAPPAGQRSEKPVSFCGDVLPILTQKCTNGVCHGSGGGAAAGLVLDSQAGIQLTAFGRVANSANTGAVSGNPSRPRGVFGIDMPLIAPGEPDNSWLLYKIELAREPAIDAGAESFICNSRPEVDEIALPTPDPLRYQVRIRQPNDLERAILSDFVPGREMPYPPESILTPRRQALSFDERQRIRMWITQGAKLSDCGGCSAAAFVPDGGEPDGGAPAPNDAGGDADLDAGAVDAADQ